MNLNPLGVGLSCLALSGAACGTASEREPFQARVRVTDPEGRSIPGALVAFGSGANGRTDEDGVASVALLASLGETVRAKISCPDGYQTVPIEKTLVLTRTRPIHGARDTRAVQVSASCRREVRQIALVVLAPQAPGLPVLADGTPIATTSSGGTAHVVLERSWTATRIDISLDTGPDERLHPRSPARSFSLGSTDAVIVFQPTLMRIAPRRRPRRASPVPYRLQ